MRMKRRRKTLKLFAALGVHAVMHGHVHRNELYEQYGVQLANGAGAVCDDPVSMLKYNRLTYDGGKNHNYDQYAADRVSNSLNVVVVPPLQVGRTPSSCCTIVTCMIPMHLKYQIESLEKRVKGFGPGQTKIALFDFDNTLLIGDIGEAVFARLLADGAPLKCTWEEYQSFLRCDVTAAYRLVVESMAGLAVREVEQATVRVLNQSTPFIKTGNAHVTVPKPHPGMKKLVSLLQKLRYSVYVISASNQTSVRIAAEEFFGIPPEYSFGIEPKTVNGVLSATLVRPFPIAAGKVDVYRKSISTLPPLITATDSVIDAPMLGLTDPMGLSLWVGKSRSEFKDMREGLGQPQKFCFVQRPRNYSFKNRVRTFGEQRSREVVSSTVFAEM